jgi:hypothetical protein
MRVFTPYTAILPPEQQQVWPYLAPLQSLGFVLYGGTAIALRLGHRPSMDFDFFTAQPLQQALILHHIPLLAHAQTVQQAPDTWTVLVNSPLPPGTPPASANFGTTSVKVSFFGGIDVGRIGEPERTSDGIITVASAEDLLAHKLKVMLQRVEAKDYRDVAALLRSGVALEQGLGGAATLFGPNFQPAESLKALVYFVGGDLATLDHADRTTLQTCVAAIDPRVGLPAVPRLSRSLIA